MAKEGLGVYYEYYDVFLLEEKLAQYYHKGHDEMYRSMQQSN